MLRPYHEKFKANAEPPEKRAGQSEERFAQRWAPLKPQGKPMPHGKRYKIAGETPALLSQS